MSVRKVFLLGLLFCLLANARAGERAAQVDELFIDYQGQGMPGAAVLVLKDGQPVLVRVYGLADIAETVPVKPETNFRLASISKQFTATSIMLLVSRGQLSLNDNLADLFEGFPGYGSQITIRELLGHTSGLLDYESMIPDDYEGQVTDRDALDYMMQVDHTYFVPGSEYRYSNTGYAILAVLVEQTSGMPFPAFLKENIFKPLGMDNSVAFQKGISTVKNRAYGYSVEAEAVAFSDQSTTSAVLGDGGIYTSIFDYAKWDAALYTDQILSAEARAQMWSAGLGEYGLGWRVDLVDGNRRLHHDGSTSGFRNYVIRYPDQHLTVLVLSNRRGPSVKPLAEAVAKIYLH
jgi:CubicO group peptidase (beta-lactamase class C family)